MDLPTYDKEKPCDEGDEPTPAPKGKLRLYL